MLTSCGHLEKLACVAAVCCAACGGGGSNSEVPSGGSAGNSSTGTGATSSTGGNGAGGGASCPALTQWTEAIHYVLDVTWPATTAANQGSGKVDLWSRLVYTADTAGVSISVSPCGTVLPEVPLNAVGTLAAGGDTVLIEFQDAVWDDLTKPPSMATGVQTGHDVGSGIRFSFNDQLGVTLADPEGAWPAAAADVTPADVDADTKPGYTATPRGGGGYVLPPTTIGLGGSAPAADKLYLVSRQVITIDGTRTACDAHSGSATVSFFDNHVVGCHVQGGDDCTPTQSDFVDQNRTKYVASGATYSAKTVTDGASCSAVRQAVP
jgi:prepilin-type processing-associated H-X9-DG protein